MSDRRKRLHTLLTDRATQGLDAHEQVELGQLLEVEDEAIDPSYAQAAAAIELALLPHGEPMPANVEAAVLEQAARYYGFTEARHHVKTIGTRALPPEASASAPIEPAPEAEARRERPAEDSFDDLDLDDEDDDEQDDEEDEAQRARRRSAGASLSAAELPAPRSGNKLARYAAYFSALAAVIVLGLGIWQFRERSTGEPAPEELRAQVEAAKDHLEWSFAPRDDPAVTAEAGGAVVWSSELQAGVLELRGLQQNDPTAHQYQLWIVDGRREGPPIDGGVFDVPAGGDLLVPVDPNLIVGDPTAFLITVEQPGGVVVSKRARVAMVAEPG